MQAIIDAQNIASKVVCVVSSNESAYGLTRAKNHDIPILVASTENGFGELEITRFLRYHDVDLVILAGYLKIVKGDLLQDYAGKIINIHPSLLPKYGGPGFYGMRVHEAVIKNNEVTSGATVHYVDAGVDTGEIILQKALTVNENDTPESLGKRILHEIEHKLIVDVIKMLESGNTI